MTELIERIWHGRASEAAFVRAALRPLSAAYGVAIRRRNARYDASPPPRAPLPAISVGNLSVGGTGKTPVASWIAQSLLDAGATPAIVLRGYGADEPLVHSTLLPSVPVIVDADRQRGMQSAIARGATVAVLDDAFQHRRAARLEDVVLISADRWTGRVDLLPAGPFREPFSSLRRATLVAVTVKASAERVNAVRHAVEHAAPGVPVGVLALAADEIVSAADAQRRVALTTLVGQRVLLVSGIGDPIALARQVAASGVAVTPLAFPDHESYGPASLARIMAAAAGSDAVLCTLKDAVKLATRWPQSAPPLWYLTQRVSVLEGASVFEAAVTRLVAAAHGGRVKS